MIKCKDCGKKNFAVVYCVKCSGDLYAKSRASRRIVRSIFDAPLIAR
ncbi:MAG TPA: hypothetical protein VFK80_10210 [Limnochordia bacterium]|nr:hypothetical protein [Limnochordia bacterium]